MLFARICPFIHAAAFEQRLSSHHCCPDRFYHSNSKCLTNRKKEPAYHLRSELAGAHSSNRAFIVPPNVSVAVLAADDDGAGRLAGFSGDLYSMTAPPFILSPISLTGSHVLPLGYRGHPAHLHLPSTEFAAYWLERPELFADISSGVNEEDRALRVLKWFIVRLAPHPAYGNVN